MSDVRLETITIPGTRLMPSRIALGTWAIGAKSDRAIIGRHKNVTHYNRYETCAQLADATLEFPREKASPELGGAV